ncbi:hypothetical protein Bsp3421_003928 [Burkholderia sp. FERM BP-3421]|uniref:hypothetical protein n=1 Tax=Burkholderia sp. FERM BP-3421 TaxID=1494466 RepID=UPI00235EE83C|nr:hypothetical protein [Burkholderia sp. FERM BP-3421]WDD93828.1 hypothetical protein Bsp3421_003928 [Burkholderia sp. FERM BP-3421]
MAQHARALTPADLPSMANAVVMNAWTRGIAARRRGAATLPASRPLAALLHRAHEREPRVAP